MQEIGYQKEGGDLLHTRAEVAEEEGRTCDAERGYQAAITLYDEIRDPWCAAHSRAALGVLLARDGRMEEARSLLESSCATARELGVPGTEVLCLAHLASLPGGEAAAAEEALTRHEGRLTVEERLDCRLTLFQVTGKVQHIEEARRLLAHVVEHAPPECRRSVLENVRVNREIVAAARQAGLTT